MKYVLLLVALWATGCSRPEAAKSLAYADVAAQGIVKECSTESPRIPVVQQLATQVSDNIEPVYETLGGKVKIDATPETAITNVNTFIKKATLQAGRAGQEAASSSILESEGMQGLLVGLLGGVSPILALYASRMMSAYKLKKQADQDQVAYAEEVTNAKTDEEIKAVQDKHYKRQMSNGTHKILYERRKS